MNVGDFVVTLELTVWYVIVFVTGATLPAVWVTVRLLPQVNELLLFELLSLLFLQPKNSTEAAADITSK